MNKLRAIRRTRRVLTAGRWFLIIGLCFYSTMTTTPFVAQHSEWAWSGFALGLLVDAAFIMALSAESTLATFGTTLHGGWPRAFRWFTGLASVFLNVWTSVAARDPVGVAVHVVAPALVMLLAEVGPVYAAALTRVEDAARTQMAALAAEAALAAPERVADVPAQRLSTPDARAVIERGYRAGQSAQELAPLATRHPVTVAKVFRELRTAAA